MYVYMYIHPSFMTEPDAKVFKALGDETRLKIIGYLLKNEHCACDFNDMRKDQTTISRHLKVLTEAGLISCSKNGRNMVYSIKDEATRTRLMSMGIRPQERCCDNGGKVPKERVSKIVKKKYGSIAVNGGSCGCGSGCCGSERHDPIQISASLGYSQNDIDSVPDANLGLGCGNPSALGDIKEGDTVLDLGSGAGMDAFIAARKVGAGGRVIGVDLTEEMVKKAKRNAKKHGFTNVVFKRGDIEDLPVESGSVDVILSNCVINLAPNKHKVFSEAFRVLRPGGKMLISDMVLLEELTPEQRADEDLISGCIGGASLREDYLKLIRSAGFQIEKIVEDPDISKRQYDDVPAESIKVVARKDDGGAT